MPADIDLYPLLLLGVGMGTILVLILYFRVNAFLALIGAALLVGLLSPRVIFETPPPPTSPAAEAQDTDRPRLQLTNAPNLVTQAFGRLMMGIGLAIALATIIGAALMESGSADRIVRSVTGWFGERYAGLAMLVSGYVLAVPVFFDTVFLLLVPLAKALRLRTGSNYLLYITAIGAGGALTHSLVPPTPGPISMSEQLGVDLGMTILVGFTVGIPLALIGLGYAAFINKVSPVPLRAVGDTSLEELEQRALKPDRDLPTLSVALLPIVLPVLLITGATVFNALSDPETGPYPELNHPLQLNGVDVTPGGLLNFLGDKNMALLFAAILAMVIVVRQKHMSRGELSRFTGRALDDAGMILLITSAGGAFGAMLAAVGVGDTLGALANEWGVAPLVLAWAIAALFKVAQGSGTVAMITTAGIVAGIVNAQVAATGLTVNEYLGYHPVYLIMAIGCGSKVGSWMNDSGFWVVCKMSGMNEVETLKSWTMTLVLMGVAGLPLVWLLTQLFPLI